MPSHDSKSSQRNQEKRANSAIKTGLIGILLTISLLSILLVAATGTSQAGENIWTWTGVVGNSYKILTDPHHPKTVYVRNNDGILKSTDGGDSWSNITQPVGGGAACIAMARSDPNVLYTGTISGTLRSDNGGATWQNLDTDGCVYAVSPADWSEAYAVEGVSLDVGISASILWKTIDGGRSWTELSGWPLSYGTIEDIVVAPSSPNTLIAIMDSAYLGKIYKSVDGGVSWAPMGGGFLGRIFSAAFDPKNSSTIYLATEAPGGWKSIDGGQNWQPLANGLLSTNYGYVIDPDNTQVIYAANGTGGVRESLDGGASWLPINNGIDSLLVRSVGIGSTDPLEVYAGMISGAGLWKLTRTDVESFGISINNGALFTNQTGVELNITAPPGTTEMMLSNDGGFGGATWESFATTKPWTITSLGSAVIPRTVYAKFKTNGQISGVYPDDIILDQTPPTGSVQIADTVSYLPAMPFSIIEADADTYAHSAFLPIASKNYWLGYRLVRLALLAADDVSGVDSMLVSNESSLADAQWQKYTAEMDWWVYDTTAAAVYVQYRDRAGNESPVYSVVSKK